MNKIAKANVVYSGWMVKSPPEKKFRLPGAWKIFRAVSVPLRCIYLPEVNIIIHNDEKYIFITS